MADNIRYASIGAIGVGNYENAELVAVCDTLEEALEPHRKNGVATYTDYLEMLDKEDLDLILVKTPSHLHVAMVCAALEKDINVYGEKPMAVNVQELKKMLKVCEASKGLYRCGMELRVRTGGPDYPGRHGAPHPQRAMTARRADVPRIAQHTSMQNYDPK